MTNPKRLYETERKRQQRARKQAGQTNRVAVYLTDQVKTTHAIMAECFDMDDSEIVSYALTQLWSDLSRQGALKSPEAIKTVLKHTTPRQTTTHQR